MFCNHILSFLTLSLCTILTRYQGGFYPCDELSGLDTLQRVNSVHSSVITPILDKELGPVMQFTKWYLKIKLIILSHQLVSSVLVCVVFLLLLFAQVAKKLLNKSDLFSTSCVPPTTATHDTQQSFTLKSD